MKYYKICYLFLLCSLPRLLLAQQLKGAYCCDNGFDGACITFKEGNRFYYSYAGCLGGVEGRGTYSLLADQLVLSFTPDTVTQTISWRIDTIEAAPDSVRWRFSVVDEFGEALPGTAIRIKEKNIGTLTDMDGRAEMVLPRNNDSLPVVVTWLSINSNDYPLMLSRENGYKVYLTISNTFLGKMPEGTIYRYTIRNVRRRSFELKSEDKGAAFKRYKKVRVKVRTR